MARGRPPKIIDPTSSPLAAFGHALRTRRIETGLPIAQVAARAGCSRSILGAYERGERLPADEQLVRDLAAVLAIDAATLVGQWTDASRSNSVAVRSSTPRSLSPLVAVAGACVAIVATLIVITDDDPVRHTRQATDRGSQTNESMSEGAGSVHAEPAADLIDGQRVVVTGSGWRPRTEVAVFECFNILLPNHQSPCANFSSTMTDASGSFRQAFVAVRQFKAGNDANKVYDCTVPPHCNVIVGDQATNDYAWSSLSFDQ